MINHFQLGMALAALKEKDEALAVLRDGLEADPGDLPESQTSLLRSRMEGMIHDLELPAGHL